MKYYKLKQSSEFEYEYFKLHIIYPESHINPISDQPVSSYVSEFPEDWYEVKFKYGRK